MIGSTVLKQAMHLVTFFAVSKIITAYFYRLKKEIKNKMIKLVLLCIIAQTVIYTVISQCEISCLKTRGVHLIASAGVQDA